MPRAAVIAISVAGVLALIVSTTFALVRSSQLRAALAELAEARARLGEDPGDGPGAPESEPSNPLDDLLGGRDGAALGDLFSEDGPGLEELLGGDAGRLARCIQQAGAPGGRDVPAGAPSEQIARIADLVAQLRSLEYVEDPDPTFLDDERLARRLEAEVREQYEPAAADADRRALAALGAVPADIDLIALQTELLSSQVAGFYDPETGELVVRGAPDDGLDPTAQATLAHELQHVLADQAFELPVDVTEDVSDGDAALAALSVVEGDATLTQQQFTLVGLTVGEQLGLGADPDALAAQRQLDTVPHYVAQSLQFPYLVGLRFACDRYLDGGWAGLNDVYDELPTTSAEIMDPQRYPAPAVDPRDPGTIGGDWERRLATTFGAADLLWLFQAPGDDTSVAVEDAYDRALAWTGGELVLWADRERTAVGIALTQQADGPLCDALVTWYERAFPASTDAPTRRDERMVREAADQTAVITCDGEDVRLGIAPDLRTARALVR